MNALVALAALTIAVPVSAQEIGDVHLHIGDSERVVSAMLRSFSVTPPGPTGDDVRLVTDSAQWQGGRPDIGNLGSVVFIGGVLVDVTRRWSDVAVDEIRSIDPAIAALRELEGGAQCLIHKRNSAKPNLSVDGVEVACAGHSIVIATVTEPNWKHVEITESWYRPTS